MSTEEYRNALENMHKLVDELEDVTMENQVLTQENIELEKDVQFIAEKHNSTVEGIKQLANSTRNYRVNSKVNNQCVCEHCKAKDMMNNNQNPNTMNNCNCEKCNPPMNNNVQNIDTSNLLSKFTNKLNVLKNKSIFIITLILIIMLAVGASPSNVISWKAFTDLYIEFICNPATMAMAVALVVLMYKGIVKRKK